MTKLLALALSLTMLTVLTLLSACSAPDPTAAVAAGASSELPPAPSFDIAPPVPAAPVDAARVD